MAMWGNTNRRIPVEAGLGKKKNPILKITNCKKGWQSSSSSRAPALEMQGPESTPSTTKNKNYRGGCGSSLL
jgi:hypothetical protein